VVCEDAVPDGVDPVIHDMQPPAPEPQPDRPATRAHFRQLATSHDPMLALRNLGNDPIQRTVVGFSITVVPFLTSDGHGRHRDRTRVARG
jgi:hypothetical protein